MLTSNTENMQGHDFRFVSVLPGTLLRHIPGDTPLYILRQKRKNQKLKECADIFLKLLKITSMAGFGCVLEVGTTACIAMHFLLDLC